MKNYLKHYFFFILCGIWSLMSFSAQAQEMPWAHGVLQVSANHRYLQHTDGTPFFWLGDTGWLLSERLKAFYP